MEQVVHDEKGVFQLKNMDQFYLNDTRSDKCCHCHNYISSKVNSFSHIDCSKSYHKSCLDLHISYCQKTNKGLPICLDKGCKREMNSIAICKNQKLKALIHYNKIRRMERSQTPCSAKICKCLKLKELVETIYCACCRKQKIHWKCAGLNLQRKAGFLCCHCTDPTTGKIRQFSQLTDHNNVDEYQCHLCLHKPFHYRSWLDKHIRIEHLNLGFHCVNDCFQNFRTKADLLIHQKNCQLYKNRSKIREPK